MRDMYPKAQLLMLRRFIQTQVKKQKENGTTTAVFDFRLFPEFISPFWQPCLRTKQYLK